MGLFVCVWVCYHDNSKLHASLHQTGSVGEGSDHLQLSKFWLSCASGKGVCGGAKFFGSALLQPARSICVSLSAFFIVSSSFEDFAVIQSSSAIFLTTPHGSSSSVEVRR